MADADDEAAIRERLRAYAEKHPIRLNPDAGVVDGIVKALATRIRKYGVGYCPCRRVTGNPDIDRDNVCPCVHALGEVAADGHCHCRLYVAPEPDGRK